MSDYDAMLEAHVCFEMDRLTDNGQLRETIAAELAALLAWLDKVQLQELLDKQQITKLADHFLSQAPAGDEVVALLAPLALAAHRMASENRTLLGELIPPEAYDRLVRALIGMEGVRQEAIDQVTTNQAYSQLIAHVLYQGIKNYMQTENIIAKKVPGASTLLRLGQSAVSTAAPKLEKSIDRQLTAFVNANIQSSIRESQHFLSQVVDESLLIEVADQVWQANSNSTVAAVAELVPADTVIELVAVGGQIWEHSRSVPAFREAIVQVAGNFLEANGSRTVADVLSTADIEVEIWAESLVDLLTPLIAKTVADGFLEDRIRARLAPFYASYAT